MKKTPGPWRSRTGFAGVVLPSWRGPLANTIFLQRLEVRALSWIEERSSMATSYFDRSQD